MLGQCVQTCSHAFPSCIDLLVEAAGLQHFTSIDLTQSTNPGDSKHHEDLKLLKGNNSVSSLWMHYVQFYCIYIKMRFILFYLHYFQAVFLLPKWNHFDALACLAGCKPGI